MWCVPREPSRSCRHRAADDGPVTEPEPRLSEEQEAFLRKYAGVREATPRELAELAARTAARDAFELTHSLTRPAVAALLGKSEHSVLGMTAAGRLYAHTLAGDGLRWPGWQFAGGRPLPHLAAVVAALPSGTHPVTLRAFMITPDPALRHDDVAVSPRDWLLGGGDVTAVLELAGTLGEQM